LIVSGIVHRRRTLSRCMAYNYLKTCKNTSAAKQNLRKGWLNSASRGMPVENRSNWGRPLCKYWYLKGASHVSRVTLSSSWCSVWSYGTINFNISKNEKLERGEQFWYNYYRPLMQDPS
jgi:hypothetical protein